MSIGKRLAIGAGTATLALALGVTVLSPVVAGAQESTTSTTTDEAGGAEGSIDRVDRIRDLLDVLVTDGIITSAQADAVAEHLAQFAFHGGHRRGRLLVGLEVAADAIGIAREALIDALQDGQTIAEVAAANGVDAETVIDALVNEYQQKLDELVAAGSITADEAAERAAVAAERITELVNGEFDFRPRFGPRPVPEASSTSSTDGA
jgi:hypothetical protein